ncbi:MAG: carbohydrate kinase family protein [Brachymonas sp.]|nr:carbohydrate kinase family protein [Brachymonas sp.]
MAILISGSLAFDNILVFNGRFADQILPQQIARLNVSFLTPQMRSDYGGCAGNIAYALKQLGGEPLPLATLGKDGTHYLQRLQQLQIDTRCIALRDDCYTGQCTIVTDEHHNQITAFHPGAMGLAQEYDVPADTTIKLAIVSPNAKEAIQLHARQLHLMGVPFVFDPGQALPQFAADELDALIEQASWITVNDYEAFLLCENLGVDRAGLSRRVRGLIVTLGENGCEVWQNGDRHVIAAVTPSAVLDPTGCGDAWRAALLYGLERGWDLLRCARLGNYMGSVKVAHRGPQNYQIDPGMLQMY